MDRLEQLEEKIETLEKKTAELEQQLSEQPEKIILAIKKAFNNTFGHCGE